MNLLYIYAKECYFSTINKEFKAKTQEKQENNSKSIRKPENNRRRKRKTRKHLALYTLFIIFADVMRIDIITVLPEMLEGFFNESILARAQKKGLAEIHLHNLRDYTDRKSTRLNSSHGKLSRMPSSA